MLLCTTSAHKLETVYDHKFLKMSTKESCGKEEKSQKKQTTSSLTFDEDKKEEEISTGSSSSVHCVKPAPTKKRKLKPDDTDIVYYNSNKQGLKRLNVEVDTPRKRPKFSSATGVASYSNNNQIASQSCSSSRTKDTKLKDSKLTNIGSKLDYEVKNYNNFKITEDIKSKAEGQTKEKNWSHSLIQKKMKELKEKSNKLKESCEGLEKCKKNQLPPNYNFSDIIKEPFESERKKISFKIPKKSPSTLQKLVEENVFSVGSSKSKTKQEEKQCLQSYQISSDLSRHKTETLFSDSTHKQAVCEGKRKYHREHQEVKGSDAQENCTQSFETPCSSVSPESIQDTDEEMQIVEELHAARVGKSVDLPVVPPSGELMSMEIDLVEDDVHSSANTASDKKLLIVIDTNVLMNHLKFVNILKTTEIPGFDTLVLIIPWVVMQELDRMKAGKLLKHVQHKAVPAIHFINNSLRNQDRKLWGQSLQLASQKLYGLSDENNDDRVLKCCLQYQELFPCSLVILCTDDRNLRSKGIISGVKSLSKEELDAEILNLTLNTDMCHQPCVSKQQLKAAIAPVRETSKEESTNSGLSILLEHIICDLEKSLGTALSSILETEMKIAFGDLWMEVLYLKPPWTLINLLQCFKKHWMAVFGLVMENKLLLTIESLYENLSKANNSVDFTTVKFLLQDSKSLLHAFSTRSNYDGILPQTFVQVNKLLQVLAEAKTKFKPNSSGSTVSKKQDDTSLMKLHNQDVSGFLDSPVHQLPQFTRHQEIWSVLENVWTSIYQNSTDVFQTLDSSSTLTTSKIASFEEAFIYLQKLMAAVKDILEGIQRILAPNSNYQDIETLYNFLIKYEVNKNVKFTAQELYDCVSQTEYRPVCVGQLLLNVGFIMECGNIEVTPLKKYWLCLS
ncbi:transcriptional protein SWT1 isoform X2 [Acomys russatus]|uniref:transcriptional protein SWT1 isoform X2 n=1 Tax=Acomys russatus TaxID=60746 RepID=UPI0021E1D195|nr:transcriptional protein SWT1 isoform X2 [Acomys russatus]XP_051003508.1 transcriptional protein SWT1 isoform X2 [Acomys russatus]